MKKQPTSKMQKKTNTIPSNTTPRNTRMTYGISHNNKHNIDLLYHIISSFDVQCQAEVG